MWPLAGDAIVREIDVSRITVRLVEKSERNGEDEKHVLAKLSGDLLPVLRQCLNTESELTIQGQGTDSGKVKVLMKYLPIKMQLDPSESMNNMGTLRVEVLDAKNLPAADKNGYSDPYCKFELNGETVHKTKTVKKTLNPSWGESFEVPIKSRTAAKLKVKINDWDQIGDDDFLGEAGINLEHLDPMLTKNIQLTLDGEKGPGTAGILNLRLLFKAAYVQRSRRTTTTFSPIGAAGKVVGAPVKIVGKVGGGVGGGLMKGASFMKHGLKGSKDSTVRDSLDNVDQDGALPSVETPPRRSTSLAQNESVAMGTPSPRAPSMDTLSPGAAGANSSTDVGVANISVLSATGYPSGTKIQVIIKALVGGKRGKELLKTKPIKNSGPESNLTWDSESTKHTCSADSQFQVAVEDHGLLGGKDLGDALFFINDSSPGGSEKSVKVGAGTVVLKSAFIRSEGSVYGAESLKSNRRSFLSRSRGATPS